MAGFPFGRLRRFAIFCGVTLCVFGAAIPRSGARLVASDDRMTVAEYAKAKGLSVEEVEQMFAATGLIECPNRKLATGNLVLKNDLVITSAHRFFHHKNGRALLKPESCRFVTKSNDGIVRTPLSSEFQHGWTKGPKCCGRGNDWIVIRLKRPVPDVTPYNVSKLRVDTILGGSDGGWNVTVVAASHSDWPNPPYRVKSVADCKIMVLFRPSKDGGESAPSDCDAAPSSSGGAYLFERPDGQRTLVAIIQGGWGKSPVVRHDFDMMEHHTRATLVSGRFQNAIHEMALKMTVTEVQQTLTDLGYKPGPVDGAMGGKTRAAIRAFERDKTMKVTGKNSVQLSKALGAAQR